MPGLTLAFIINLTVTMHHPLQRLHKTVKFQSTNTTDFIFLGPKFLFFFTQNHLNICAEIHAGTKFANGSLKHTLRFL